MTNEKEKAIADLIEWRTFNVNEARPKSERGGRTGQRISKKRRSHWGVVANARFRAAITHNFLTGFAIELSIRLINSINRMRAANATSESLIMPIFVSPW